jgi:hypothetical protein
VARLGHQIGLHPPQMRPRRLADPPAQAVGRTFQQRRPVRVSLRRRYITAEASYGSTEIPIFMLAKDGAIVADDPGKMRFSLEGEQVDEHSGKPFAQVVTYEYEDGADRYVIRYHLKSTIVDDRMLDHIKGSSTCWPRRPGSTARTFGSRAR